MPFMPEDIRNKPAKKEYKKIIPKDKLDLESGLIKKSTEQNPPFLSQNNKSQVIPKINPEVKKMDTITTKREKLTKDFTKQKNKIISDQFRPLLSWEAAEYISLKKGFLWYLMIMLLAILSIALSFYYKQWILIIVIVVFIIVLFQYSRRKPRIKKCTVSEYGIKVNNKNYLFSQFQSFWFIESPEISTLHLQPLKKLSLVIVVPLTNNEKEKLRSILSRHLPEQGKTESIIDKVSQKLKF